MEKKLLFLILACIYTLRNYSQQIWKQTNNYYNGKQNPTKYYNSLQLNKDYFLTIVKNAPSSTQRESFSKITLPINEKEFEIFEIFKTSYLAPELEAKYPSIKSFIGRSLTSNKIARISYSKYSGFHAAISTSKGTYLIKPHHLKSNSYLCYDKSNGPSFSNFECNTIATVRNMNRGKQKYVANDQYLRKYRLAIATTAAYSNFFLTGNEKSNAEKKAIVLSHINNSITRINGIFERDFGITMELIPNNDALIFLTPETDPFNSNDYNNSLQTTLDNSIGNTNYDIGHLFAYEISIHGNAGCIACVCTDQKKGSAFTAHNAPDSDHFNLIASHEFGHQFGGYHVQSSANCRSSIGLQEVEPGSGSSIMSYAGICSPIVQESPDDYFNYVDIRDIIQWARNESSCAELIPTNNTPPSANAGDNYIIPKSTPFILTGSGTDIDHSSILSYCWEQNDPEDPKSVESPQPTWTKGPLFRSRPPIYKPTRYIPQLSDVINGNFTPKWEVLPAVQRTMDFALTVRDNAIIGAKTASDKMTITVTDNAGPFIVTSQNTTETWHVGEIKTINWNVANTNNPPINTSHINILLSTDGGYTYPYTIASDLENNGSAIITVPEIEKSTKRGRIMIQPKNNIFYAINAMDIHLNTSEFTMSFPESHKEICKPNEIIYNFTYKTYVGFNEITTFTTENLPQGFNATFNPSAASKNNTPITLTISSTNSTPTGRTDFSVIGLSNTVRKKSFLSFHTYNNFLTSPTSLKPANNAQEVDTDTALEWNFDINAKNYTIQLSKNLDFSNIIEQANTTENIYHPNRLALNTTYFWRVKNENICSEGTYSKVFSFTTKCFPPENILITNITKNSAKITWTDSYSLNWEVQIVPEGTSFTNTGINTYTPSYTPLYLIPRTNYDVYIRSLCSNTNRSSWVGPFLFTTLPDYCNGGLFYDTGGFHRNYLNNENTITTILPSKATDIVEVSFSKFHIEDGYDYLLVYNGNSTNSPLIGNYTGSTSPGTLRSKQGQGLTFSFISDDSITNTGWVATVDCITITCPPPHNLSSHNTTSNSSNISWTSNGTETEWLLEYGVKGFTIGKGINKISKSTTYTLTNLIPQTEYDVYLKAICGNLPNDDDSNIIGPISFKTSCGIFNAPYLYNVEDQNLNTPIHDCWSATPSLQEAHYFWEVQRATYSESKTGPYKAHEGDQYFRTTSYTNASSGDVAVLETPFVNISSLENPVLHFFSFLYGSHIGSLHIDIFSNDTWINDILTLSGAQQNSSKDLWHEHLINLKDFSDIVKIRFRAIANGNTFNEINIDKISFTEKPSCPSPTNIQISNTTINSSNISWSSNGEESEWVLEYGEENFHIGNGTILTINSTPFTLNNLKSNTSYDFYLKANCSNKESNNIGPFKIKTRANCTGDNFYDSGGFDTMYSNNENYTTTIFPPNETHKITVNFHSFELESCCDELLIFDGPNTDAQLIGIYTGNNSPNKITSTHYSGALTFKFTSDSSITYPGWEASVSCEGTLGYPSIFENENFHFFPNPVHEILTISSNDYIKLIEVYNIIGKKLLNLTPHKDSLFYKIDFTSFSSGVYIVKIYRNNNVSSLRILKN
ncbi:reprolysin-like metallopeptidase [Tenacibaculum maritimum]|uniref:reprolysin-like metallopeptidase n=1 Tax=Tenacibaculum maritimum TaxID=107401 RepID=UPI0012E6C943|nr:CUB domain-containing protein [Tenacibaculum maritimum]CAA0184589.1 Probable M12B family metalloprotease precursor containing a C-terminal secretion signal [Tenacibaculum maritimum]